MKPTTFVSHLYFNSRDSTHIISLTAKQTHNQLSTSETRKQRTHWHESSRYTKVCCLSTSPSSTSTSHIQLFNSRIESHSFRFVYATELDSPYCVSFFGSFLTPEELWISLEFCDLTLGTLLQVSRRRRKE